MFPDLFQIGPIPIRAWGLMLALAFLSGVWYVKYVTRRDGKPFEPFLNVAYVLIIGGILGARLSYVALHWSDFSGNLGGIINPFHSGGFGIAGMNLYGGVLMATVLAWIYCRVARMNVLDVFDYFAGPLALGIGISRIGCFLNGCCFGTPTDLPWGITFPVGSLPFFVYGEVPLHPAQIYSSLYGFMLFIGLHFLLKRRKFEGQLLAVLFMVEAALRFAFEYVRYYESAMWLRIGSWEPTYNQLASIGLFVAGAILYIVLNRRKSARGTAADHISE